MIQVTNDTSPTSLTPSRYVLVLVYPAPAQTQHFPIFNI